MKQIENGFGKEYYLTEQGIVYNSNNKRYLKAGSKKEYRLMTEAGKKKCISQKQLYKMVYNKCFCEDKIEDLINEQWKPIADTEEEYLVSNMGRVKSLKGYEAKLLKPTITDKGYARVQITTQGLSRNIFIHRLVAAAFLPLPESIEAQIHHKDYNRSNNNADNLEWLTPAAHFNKHQIKES